MHFWTVFGAWWVAFGLLNAPIWGLHFRSWKGAAYGFSTGAGGFIPSLIIGFFLFARWYDARAERKK